MTTRLTVESSTAELKENICNKKTLRFLSEGFNFFKVMLYAISLNRSKPSLGLIHNVFKTILSVLFKFIFKLIVLIISIF